MIIGCIVPLNNTTNDFVQVNVDIAHFQTKVGVIVTTINYNMQSSYPMLVHQDFTLFLNI
jgi:hypothetical protein